MKMSESPNKTAIEIKNAGNKYNRQTIQREMRWFTRIRQTKVNRVG